MKTYIQFIAFLMLTINVSAFQKNSLQEFRDSIQIEIKKLPSDSLRAKKFYMAAIHAMQRLNDLKLCRTYIDSAMYYSRISNFKDSEAKCHFLYGMLERVEGNYEVALKHLDSNIRYFKHDSTAMAYALFQVGVIYNELGDNESSLKNYLTILQIFERKKDSFAIGSTLNSIGVIYGEMNRYNEAIDNFNQAVTIFKNLNQQRDVANTFGNIGEIYLQKKDTVKSREYLERSLKIARDIKEDFDIGHTLHLLGKTYLDTQPKKAFKYLFEAEHLLEKIDFKPTLIGVYRDLGHYYKGNKKFDKSIAYYNKGLELANASHEQPSQKDLYKSLSDIYGQLEKYNKAYHYQSQYIIYKDSLLNEKKFKAINLLQKQFETKKKDNKITQQELEIQKQENQLLKKKTQYNYMTGIAIFLLLASVLTWFLFQQRQKRKNQEIITLKREHQIKTLESLIEGEEKERFRIAKELHDGVNGDLSAIKFKLSSLLDMNNQVIKEAVAMIDKSYEQVRAISHNLIPPSLEDFELIETLDNYCQKIDNSQEINVTFQYLGDAPKLPKKDEINIFRIVQELVSNSIKHAEATEINVQISSQDNSLQITVDDNGKGFDKDAVTGDGIGLENIQSRIEYLKASVDFSSSDRGTSYIIEIDLDKRYDN